MEILYAIGSIAGVVALVLIMIFRKGAQKYVDAKAKNLATIEDTEKITNEIEKVKTDYLQRSHAWKWIFEKGSLRPLMDRLPEDKDKRKEVFMDRYERHAKAVSAFTDLVFKNQPLIPPHVYDSCLSLRKIVVELQVDFEMSFDDEERPDWRKIHECGKKLDNNLEELNSAIRNYIHGKMKGAEQVI